VFSGSLQTGGNAAIHFDSAIRLAGEDCDPPPPPGEGEGEGEGSPPGEGEGEGPPPGEGEGEGEGDPGQCSTNQCLSDLDCCVPLLCNPSTNRCFGIGG
jgi:hypothetical protein